MPIISASDGSKILGTKFALLGNGDAEFENRLTAAWGKFHQVWPLLRKKDTSMKKRLRLFDATVTASAIWCSETWVLTKKQRNKLEAVRRSMLRRFAARRKRPDEEWISWIKAATREAESAAEKAGLQPWFQQHLRKKWRWAGRISRFGNSRWVHKVFAWRDASWQTQAMQNHGSSYRP